MPNFPKNTSSFMKYSKKGSSFPFKSPTKRDNQSWEAAGVGQKAKDAAKALTPTMDQKTSKRNKEIVSRTSPGDNYTKIKGTNIWKRNY